MSKSREYIPYYAKVDNILGKALLDIVEIFKENETKRIHLHEHILLGFDSRFVGDESCVACITDIEVNDRGWISLLTENNEVFYTYNLLNKTDISIIYDRVYFHFYEKK